MNPSLEQAIFSVKAFQYLIDQSITKTIATVMIGVQPLVKNGSGTLVLNGANTYSSGTFVNVGTVQSGAAAGFGTGPVNIAAGATAIVNVGNTTVANAFAGRGTLTCNNIGTVAQSLTMSGDLSGFGGVLNIGPNGGKLILTAATVPTSSCTVNVLSSATLYVSSALTYPFSINLSGGATGEALGQLRCEGSAVMSGPVTLLANTTIGGNSGTGTISGNISGNFTLQKLGGGTIVFTAANGFSNVLTISAGIVQLGSGGTTGDLNSATSIVNNATLQFNRTDAGLSFSTVISGTGAVAQIGTGTTTLGGANTYTGGTTVTAGTLTINGGLGVTTVTMNPASGTTATLNLNAAMTQTAAALTTGTVAGGTAIFNIAANILKGSSTQDIRTGVLGFGNTVHTAGTVSPGGFFCIGITGANARGMYDQSGGSVVTPATNTGGTIGATQSTTRGEYNLSGGTYSSTDATASGVSGIYAGEVGTGILNVIGGSMTLGGASTSKGLAIGVTSASSCIGIVNLTSGTINACRVQKPGAAALGYLNFLGGTLKALSYANSTFLTGLTQANVWPGGGTIDNSNVAITVGQALIAPAGFGISAISTTGFGVLTGYTAKPFVIITGGTGVSATARAIMSGGTVTGFTVDCPGTGFGSGDTVTVTLSGGGFATTTSSTTAVTLSSNTSGGLTFAGAAVTTLSAANTYTGTTTVSAGTLSVTGSIAGPATVSGGTLQGSGTVTGAVTVANVASSVIAGGTGAGTVTTLTTGALTFNGSTAALNVTTNGTTACSLVTSTGAVTLGGATVNLLGALNTGTYTLIGGASMSGTVVVGTNSTGHTVSSCSVVGNNLTLVLV